MMDGIFRRSNLYDEFSGNAQDWFDSLNGKDCRTRATTMTYGIPESNASKFGICTRYYDNADELFSEKGISKDFLRYRFNVHLIMTNSMGNYGSIIRELLSDVEIMVYVAFRETDNYTYAISFKDFENIIYPSFGFRTLNTVDKHHELFDLLLNCDGLKDDKNTIKIYRYLSKLGVKIYKYSQNTVNGKTLFKDLNKAFDSLKARQSIRVGHMMREVREMESKINALDYFNENSENILNNVLTQIKI